ncbi:MAG: hypothetical protein ACK5L0_09490 [Candidatus Fimivivens sp.]
MKIKLVALLLCVSLVAGCGAASSQMDSGSSSQAEYIPSYTYVNPDPNMVMITSPGGDITYENYRLYLDISEQFGRFYSRQEMASCVVLESDLKEMGIEINEEDYKNMAAQQVYSMMMYSPSYAENLQRIIEITGMTQEEVSDAMLLPYRSQYLVGLLDAHYQKLAEEEVDKEDADSQSAQAESAASSDGDEQAVQSSVQEDAQAERQQAIQEKSQQMMQDYFADYDTRINLDDDTILATIDGKAAPFTDEMSRSLEYTAVAGRIEAVTFIQAGELALRELENRNTEFDRTNFETTFKTYTEQLRADKMVMAQLEKICAGYDATVDDYFKALERPLWLQEVGDLYVIAMNDEYNALTVDSGEEAESVDSYVSQAFSKLLEGSEIVNITGQ